MRHADHHHFHHDDLPAPLMNGCSRHARTFGLATWEENEEQKAYPHMHEYDIFSKTYKDLLITQAILIPQQHLLDHLKSFLRLQVQHLIQQVRCLQHHLRTKECRIDDNGDG
jgi:hypothetical protein